MCLQKNSFLLTFPLIFFLLLQSKVNGQILDDSTKQVYGLKTVGFSYESTIFNNDSTLYTPDSTLNYFQKTGANSKNGWLFQDLGNIGTASMPLFFKSRTSAELFLGFNAFDLYRKSSSQVKYYNTKSPYTELSYLQTGRGNANLGFVHSQNIKPNINFTLDIERVSATKQFDLTTNREERLINGWNFLLSSKFESFNKRYKLLSHLNHHNFEQIEQGGEETSNEISFVGGTNLYSAKIADASSRTFKNTYYTYQQLKITNDFDVFHRLEIENNSIGFKIGLLKNNIDSTFFNFLDSKPDTIDWRYRNFVAQNTFGIKGYYKEFLGSLYLKQRYFGIRNRESIEDSMSVSYIKQTNYGFKNQLLLGGNIQFVIKDSLAVLNSSVEISPQTYALNTVLSIWDFNFEFKSSSSFPDFVFQYSYIPNYSWNNSSFENVNSQTLSGSYTFEKGFLFLKPFFNFELIKNYTYFDFDTKPKQYTSTFNIPRLGLDSRLNFSKYYLGNSLILNLNNTRSKQQEYFPLPKIINSTTFYYKFNYAKVLDIRLGFENHYKSAYYGQAYNPLIQQFYLQKDKKIWGFTLLDLFSSFKVNKVKLLLKYSRFPQLLLRNKTSYSSTLNYPGLGNTFNIKVEWPLFD